MILCREGQSDGSHRPWYLDGVEQLKRHLELPNGIRNLASAEGARLRPGRSKPCGLRPLPRGPGYWSLVLDRHFARAQDDKSSALLDAGSLRTANVRPGLLRPIGPPARLLSGSPHGENLK